MTLSGTGAPRSIKFQALCVTGTSIAAMPQSIRDTDVPSGHKMQELELLRPRLTLLLCQSDAFLIPTVSRLVGRLPTSGDDALQVAAAEQDLDVLPVARGQAAVVHAYAAVHRPHQRVAGRHVAACLLRQLLDLPVVVVLHPPPQAEKGNWIF